MSRGDLPPEYFEQAFREYALKYFEIHSQQRLRMFQFFVTLVTAIGGALVFLQGNMMFSWWIVLLCFFLSFLSVVFWLLDMRTRNLVKNAEGALKFLDTLHPFPEGSEEPHPLCLVARDDYLTTLKGQQCWLYRLVKYSHCFGLVFLVFFLGGAILGVFIIAK